MSRREGKDTSGEYIVGYGKAPVDRRFREGTSGNPGGRPRGMTPGRAKALALKEAYRQLKVREGEKIITMPAIQAVRRSQIALAIKGNGPAQRAFLEAVQAIEQEFPPEKPANEPSKTPVREYSSRDMAKALLLALTKPEKEDDKP